MKILILCFAFLSLSNLWANCTSTNIYEHVGEFSNHLLPRDQNYGTCYAEAASYAYNVVAKDNLKLIHPMYFMTFLGSVDDKVSVDGGSISNIINTTSSFVCPLGSIEAVVLEYKKLVKELFQKEINLINAEADIIAILQAMILFRSVDADQAQVDIVEFFELAKAKQGETFYLNNIVAAAKSIHLNLKLIPMPQDNTRVVQNLYIDPAFLMQHLKMNLLTIMKIHYLGISATDKKIHITPSFNKFFLKTNEVVKNFESDSFKNVLFEFLNKQCADKSKILINKKLISGRYISPSVEDPNISLTHMTSFLKLNLPVKLSLNARVFNNHTEGLHAVVLMGTRPTRNRTCELLIRNSWGERYQNSTSCYCYHKSKKTFESCYPSPKMDSNYTVLACWYRWSEVLSVLSGYTPTK